ncbi:ribosome maturation factor RimM [Spirulina sp. CS-785/01]|uniref:ribosome maturation factor RimM n=1 Tax=Spirulina sp. CS-785/01 TaxID=3021716 RepID=UPI00232AB273|nr:ribosome maturation factor RimM [Spirulina sp. CS-785/01]MDB9312423.1 ribosome maturation factor RimM [Spirulina sp. CS-785/01]
MTTNDLQPTTQDKLVIGKIVSAQGLKGELRVYPDSDFPERFTTPGPRWLQLPNTSQLQEVELIKGRWIPGKKLYVIQLAGITDRDQADTLRNAKLLVNRHERPSLADNEYHSSDLLNLEVFNQHTGESVGHVTEIFSAGNDLLEVQLHPTPPETPSIDLKNQKKTRKRAKKNTVLIPFVAAIVPVVDLSQGRIEIDPPPGLFDVNQS